MWSYMRPAIVIYIKKCSFSFWGFWFGPEKVDFRAIFQNKIDFLLKPVGFYYFLALFWPPRPFLISKKPPACNAGHFSIKKTYFWSKLTHFITFLSKNTSFWAPNLTHGKPDTYDPLRKASKRDGKNACGNIPYHLGTEKQTASCVSGTRFWVRKWRKFKFFKKSKFSKFCQNYYVTVFI